MSSDFRYAPLSEKEYEALWNKHKNVIESFIKKNNYSSENLYLNKNIILEIIAKVDQRKKYFQYYHGLDMSEFKEVSLIIFWYIKLKPISISNYDTSLRNKKEFDAINEKLALFYLLRTYRKMLEKSHKPTKVLDDLPEEYIREILYSFEFRDISKEALILLVESIAVFLGLEPYQKDNG